MVPNNIGWIMAFDNTNVYWRNKCFLPPCYPHVLQSMHWTLCSPPCPSIGPERERNWNKKTVFRAKPGEIKLYTDNFCAPLTNSMSALVPRNRLVGRSTLGQSSLHHSEGEFSSVPLLLFSSVPPLLFFTLLLFSSVPPLLFFTLLLFSSVPPLLLTDPV